MVATYKVIIFQDFTNTILLVTCTTTEKIILIDKKHLALKVLIANVVNLNEQNKMWAEYVNALVKWGLNENRHTHTHDVQMV